MVGAPGYRSAKSVLILVPPPKRLKTEAGASAIAAARAAFSFFEHGKPRAPGGNSSTDGKENSGDKGNGNGGMQRESLVNFATASDSEGFGDLSARGTDEGGENDDGGFSDRMKAAIVLDRALWYDVRFPCIARMRLLTRARLLPNGARDASGAGVRYTA